MPVKNRLISFLVIGFALFFMGFIIKVSHDLSTANSKILESKNVIEAGDLISTRLFVTKDDLSLNGHWVKQSYQDGSWDKIQIPTYQIIQQKNYKSGNFAYYRIKIPKEAFQKLSHLQNETFLALQSVYFSRFDVVINEKFYRTYRPTNTGENRVVLPVDENHDNIIAIKGYIRPGDTGIDSRNKIMLGKGVEFNAVHSANYKAQTVYQLVFILCKGSILFIFALIYLLLSVDRSFDKFFIFGLCAIIEELIAGDYLYGPLNFNQMVYLYNLVNIGGCTALFLFFGELISSEFRRRSVFFGTVIVSAISFALALDALYWNQIVDISKFMKFWNLLTVSILLYFLSTTFKKDKVLFFGLFITLSLYTYGAIFADNIGLNLKAYGNLLLFFLVAYQTFGIFRREQEKLKTSERLLLEQEKDVAIGRTAALLAHDVRKPLEQVKILLEELRTKEVDVAFLDVAKEDIELSIASVDQQVNDILNFSRETTPTLAELSFYSILNHALKQVFSIHREMNLDVSYNLQVRQKFIGEKGRMTNVLVNLLSNAVEAIRDIGNRYDGRIEISTFIEDERFVISIFNDGPEIPSPIINQIFKPLFTYGKPSGTGLGLASTYKAINEMGGEIECYNRTNQGVEFLIYLMRGNQTDDYNDYKLISKSDTPLKEDNRLEASTECVNVLILESDLAIHKSFIKEFDQMPFKVNIEFTLDYHNTHILMKKRRFDVYILNSTLSHTLGDEFHYLRSSILYYSNYLPGNIQGFTSRCVATRKKILFVDDTKMFRIAWLMFHGESNIKCLVSPEEALTCLKQSPLEFDVCVLDYYFSNSSLDGLKLAERLKALNPGLIIFLSSSTDQQFAGYRSIRKNDFDIRAYL